MAVIPLRDVPNAPDLSSMSAPQVNNVNLPRVDFGSEKAAIAEGYGRVIRSNKVAEQDPRAAGLVGGAVAEVGQAVYKGAKTLADKQQELNDNAAWAEFSTNYDIQKSQFEQSLDMSRPETWGASYAQFRAKNIDPAWQALPVSVQQRKYADYLNLTSKDQVKIGHDAFQARVAGDLVKQDTQINLLMEAGKFDEARKGLEGMRVALSPKQYETALSKIDTADQVHTLTRDMGLHPDEWASYLTDLETKDEAIPGLPNITKDQIPRFAEQARKFSQVQQVHITQDITSDIYSGTLKSPLDVEKDARFQRVKNPEIRQGLKNAAADRWLYTKEGEVAWKSASKMVDSYPSTDNPAQEALEITNFANNFVPSNSRGGIIDAIKEKQKYMGAHNGKLAPDQELIQYGSRQLDTMMQAGVFGAIHKHEDILNKPAKAKENADAYAKREKVEAELRSKSPKTPAEVDEIIQKSTMFNAAKKANGELMPSGKSWFAPKETKRSWYDFSPVPPQASHDNNATGKITSYGYEGDQYGGPNAKATKVGAFNNPLTDKSLAVSPDIQAKFKEAGIKPMEPVELTLADGTKVVRNYDDHTASDQEARKLGLKPLRGRFDFRSVGGKQEKDGMRIVSFRKYTEDGQG